MEKIGLVKSLEGDIAIVEIRRASACGESCASCKAGCAPTAVYARVNNSLNASVGQYVKLKTESKKVIKAAFFAYMIPFFSMIIGIAIGSWTARYFDYEKQSELIGAGVGFVSLAVSYLYLYFKDKKIKKQKDMEIVISHIIK